MAETLHIGGIELKSRVVAAPMAGISDPAYRYLSARMGAGLTVTEMVSSKGILQRNKKTASLSGTHPEGRPYAVQLFGSDVDEMAEAARIVQDAGADMVDINMGCPVKKVIRNGAGGDLMNHPERAGRMVAATRKAIDVPLTVKIRAGYNREKIVAPNFARMLVDAGADAVTIHPRSVSQGYAGDARWEIIGEAVELVDAPVIGNGNVRSADDAAEMIRSTGCAAVMIGRAAMGNPFIFREIAAELENKPAPQKPDRLEIFEVSMKHLDILLDLLPPKPAVWQWRPHLCWYAKGLPNVRELRREIFHMEEPDELRALAEQFFLNQRTPLEMTS